MARAERDTRIVVISIGGTIGLVGASRMDLSSYHETGKRQPVSELVASLPELGAFAEVETLDFRALSSTALTPSDWLDLLDVLQNLLARVDGVVVTHGTNTLEETAFFLDLSLATDSPVVVVGAMRPVNAVSSDGPLNLLRAVQVASSPEAKGHGVLVVMNERVFLARDVLKASSQGLDAFRSPDSGPIGWVDAAGGLAIDRRRIGTRVHFDLASIRELPRVDLVMTHVGADGLLIDAAVAGGARGLVSAGAGAGRPTPLEEEALKRAVESGVVVCLSSRVGSGAVLPTPNSRSAQFVAARRLVPWKARVLLSLALTQTDEPERIQALFDGI